MSPRGLLRKANIFTFSKKKYRRLGLALKGPPDIFVEITYFKSCAHREADNNFRFIKNYIYVRRNGA